MLVFYTGNTFHQPGDILSLSGDRVGAETRRVTLARVVNQRTSAAACHAQTAITQTPRRPPFSPSRSPPRPNRQSTPKFYRQRMIP